MKFGPLAAIAGASVLVLGIASCSSTGGKPQENGGGMGAGQANTPRATVAMIIGGLGNVGAAAGGGFVLGLIQNIAMKRLGSPDDIAAMVMFFASDLASFVNGQVLAVDGGK